MKRNFLIFLCFLGILTGCASQHFPCCQLACTDKFYNSGEANYDTYRLRPCFSPEDSDFYCEQAQPINEHCTKPKRCCHATH